MLKASHLQAIAQDYAAFVACQLAVEFMGSNIVRDALVFCLLRPLHVGDQFAVCSDEPPANLAHLSVGARTRWPRT